MIALNTGDVPATLAQPPAPIERPSFRRRWVAYLIDLIILSVADAFVTMVLDSAPPAVPSPSSLSASAADLAALWQVASAVIHLAVPTLYFVWGNSSGGQTIGKAVLGIKVVSIDGSLLTWRKGILRTVGYVPSTLLFGLGFLSAAWDKDKQAWHDKIAGTCVVHASVPREALVGRVDPHTARLRQRSWIVVLGIMTALAFAAFGLFVFAGVSQVTGVGPWPGRDASPEQVATVNLEHLGLRKARVIDARSSSNWTRGNFDTGVLVTYMTGEKEVVGITALRYSHTAKASGDFGSLVESAKTNCRWSTHAYWMNTGTIHCGFPGGHNRMLWNEYWILGIVALDGDAVPAEKLADKVRHAIASNWKGGEPSR